MLASLTPKVGFILIMIGYFASNFKGEQQVLSKIVCQCMFLCLCTPVRVDVSVCSPAVWAAQEAHSWYAGCGPACMCVCDTCVWSGLCVVFMCACVCVHACLHTSVCLRALGCFLACMGGSLLGCLLAGWLCRWLGCLLAGWLGG